MLNIDELVELFKRNVVDLGTKGVMSYLAVQAPVFNLPILNAVIRFLVSRVISIAVNNTELGIYFIYTDQRTSAQAKAYEKAAQENAKAKADPAVTEEEKKRAEEELLARARELIRLGR